VISVRWTRNREELLRFLGKNTELHIYEIGDLDDFFFPDTSWRVLDVNGRIAAVSMMYQYPGLPCLILLNHDPEPAIELLTRILPELPSQFYCHFSPGVETALPSDWSVQSGGRHLKMILPENILIPPCRVEEIIQLDYQHLQMIEEFYSMSYPDNWFDPRMLSTGMYRGILRNGEIHGIAGIHVYTEKYGVSALGNIATHPDHRNEGLAALVTNQLCDSLRQKVTTIGLNVHRDNLPALRCYEKIGFQRVAEYEEYKISRQRINFVETDSPDD